MITNFLFFLVYWILYCYSHHIEHYDRSFVNERFVSVIGLTSNTAWWCFWKLHCCIAFTGIFFLKKMIQADTRTHQTNTSGLLSKILWENPKRGNWDAEVVMYACDYFFKHDVSCLQSRKKEYVYHRNLGE